MDEWDETAARMADGLPKWKARICASRLGYAQRVVMAEMPDETETVIDNTAEALRDTCRALVLCWDEPKA